ncbi:MAG TPA: hypothetical protein QGH10_14650 [Armatimonadota bacterium]|nr:hypothetical protein [Armatimonadota bacterium]
MDYRLRSTLANLAVLAIAAHSIALGISMLSFPMWTLGVVGWDYSGEIFWPSQSGLFLIILGTAYAFAVRHRRMVWLIVGSKATAIVFLLAHVIWLDAPKLVILLGSFDGFMGLAALCLYLYAKAGEEQPEEADE